MSLYRKYRPQTFEDMVGQEHIAQTLRNALTSNPPRVAHAYLFCGPRGTGKTTSARLLAKCLNCEKGPTPTPCNECDFCKSVRDNHQVIHDLLEMDAASNRGIEHAKDLIEKVSVPPTELTHHKIYIIDEAHMLTREAVNALLKTLEEPPPYAVFVLATTEASKILPTVLSRCHRFDFRRVGPADIAARLQYVAKNENVALDEKAASLIARVADGGLRDALSLLEQVIAFSQDTVSEADVRLVLGSVSRELLKYLMDSLAERDAALALSSIEAASEEGVAFQQLTRDLIAYSRDALLLMMGAPVATDESEKAALGEHARKIGKARLLGFIESLRAAEREMAKGTDQRLLLELALVRATADFASEAAPPRERVVERIPERPALRPAEKRPEPRPVPQVLEAAPEPREEKVTAPTPEIREEAQAPEVADAPQVLEAPTEEAPEPAWMRSSQESAPEAAPAEPVAEEVSVPEEAAEEPAPVAPRAPAKKGRRIHDLDEFVELWPAVFRRFQKKYGVTIAAYLHEAAPVAFTETDAVLEFKKEFHYEKACEAAKRLPFEDELNKVLAKPHRLKFRLAAPKKKAAPAPEPEASPDDDEEDEEEDVFKVAKDLFAATVMGRSGA